MTFKVDTGADVNCIPLKIIEKINIKNLNQQNDLALFDYSDNKIEIFGNVNLNCFDYKTQTNHKDTDLNRYSDLMLALNLVW